MTWTKSLDRLTSSMAAFVTSNVDSCSALFEVRLRFPRRSRFANRFTLSVNYCQVPSPPSAGPHDCLDSPPRHVHSYRHHETEKEEAGEQDHCLLGEPARAGPGCRDPADRQRTHVPSGGRLSGCAHTTRGRRRTGGL